MTQTLTTTEELKHLASSDNTNELTRSLARECLANREAQPVAWSYEWASCITCEGPQNFQPVIEREAPPEWTIDEGQARNIIPLYTAPPAPVVPVVQHEPVVYMWDSERKDIDAPGYYRPEHLFFAENSVKRWGGRVVPLYTAPPAPAVPDISALTDLIVDRLIDCSAADDDSIADAETFVYNACRAAMLAQPQIEPQNIPNNIPDGLAAAVNRLLDSDGSRGCFSAVRSYDAREEIERLLAQPVSQGCKLVPVEPTAEMIQSGIAAHYERQQLQIHDRPAPGPMECAYIAMLAAAPEGGNG